MKQWLQSAALVFVIAVSPLYARQDDVGMRRP